MANIASNVGWDDHTNTMQLDPNPILKFKEDPVVLACAGYRMWQENPALRWTDLSQVVVWQDDVEKAAELRRYYRDRLLMNALKQRRNLPMSEFRKKLFSLVNGTLDITQKEVGLLHRLPYFYAEDTALDEVVALTDDTGVDQELCAAFRAIFKPLKKILVSRASGEFYHYWFTEVGKNTPYNFVIAKTNPLLGMFDSLYKREVLEMAANLYPRYMKGYHQGRKYYQLGSVELV